LQEQFGITKVHNYYGMAEQTGCIYMECECGHLHASIFSDIIMRDPLDFTVCPVGKQGIIQVMSPLAVSYPGHSILTEDMGTLLGIDDCPCGRKGKYFKVDGRIPAAEIRGCSDTYGR
jgi:phenylacetate-coenzyme A ligase PaaK-like adenylate-forming protein